MSPTSQHPPLLHAISLTHGEHRRAQADELGDRPTTNSRYLALLSDMRQRGVFLIR